MYSAAKAELGALFITSKELVPILQTLIEMVWPHTPTPIHKNYYTAVDVMNDYIIVRKTKSMDLRLHWFRNREAQPQFFYWAPVSNNFAIYRTKHYQSNYHRSKRPLFSGAAQKLYQTFLAHC